APAVGAASVRACAPKGRLPPLVGLALARLLGQRRYAAVRGINHQRCPQRRHLRAAIPPEVVVSALDVAARAAVPAFVAATASGRFFHGRHFLGGIELTAVDVGRSLEWRDRPIGERALKLGLAPRRLRGRVWLRRRYAGAAILGDDHGCRQDDADDRNDEEDGLGAHALAPQ